MIGVSAGELLDRISILELKVERFQSTQKRERARGELTELLRVRAQTVDMDARVRSLYEDLKEINGTLWVIEDSLRMCEHNETFDEAFIVLARSVYRLNDRRAAIKSQINAHVESAMTEEKSYYAYR